MSTQPDFDTMTDAELADYHYTHRDNPLGDDADLEEIEVEIAHPLSVSVSMSFRLPPQEASATSQRRVAEEGIWRLAELRDGYTQPALLAAVGRGVESLRLAWCFGITDGIDEQR